MVLDLGLYRRCLEKKIKEIAELSNISHQHILKYYKTQLNVKKFHPHCFAKVLDNDHEAPVVCSGSKSRRPYSP